MDPNRPDEPHLVFFERAGDARSAFHRWAASGEEWYHGERRSVQVKRDLAERFGRATVLTATGEQAWDEPLTPHLRAVGFGKTPENFGPSAIAWLDAARPTHLVVGPELLILEWAADRGVEVLPNFANTFFNPPGTANPVVWLRRRLGRWRGSRRFARVLRRLDPLRLLNHNQVAAEDLRRLAPRPERVEEVELMDTTPLERARVRTASAATASDEPAMIFYCGRTAPAKGFFDLMEACGILLREGLKLRLVVCGGGDEALIEGARLRHGLGDRFDWQGPRERSEVCALLDRADVAVVPSRHAYPEGLPLTLLEPLGMGVPLVASDHRSWARLRDGEEFLRHRAGDPASLARALRRALLDPALRERLSRNGPAAFERIRCRNMVGDAQRAWAEDVLAAARPGAVPEA